MNDDAHSPTIRIIEDLNSDDANWTFPAQRFAELNDGREPTLFERRFWSRGLEWNRTNLLKIIAKHSEASGDFEAAMNERWFVGGFIAGMWIAAVPLIARETVALDVNWRVGDRESGM